MGEASNDIISKVNFFKNSRLTNCVSFKFRLCYFISTSL